MFLWVTPVLVIVFHLMIARRNEQRALDEWIAHLTGADARRDVALSLDVEADAAAIGSAVTGARAARGRGDLPEAHRLLGLAFAVIEEARPDRLERLAAVGRLVRMAAAVEPAPPLSPKSFRLGRLQLLAGLATVAHHALVTPAERFLLRIGTLRLGFLLAFRVLTAARATIALRPTAARAWARFENGAADWRCLDAEHLESFRAFVQSIRLRPVVVESRS